PRTASRWRAATTSWRCRATTPSSPPSRAAGTARCSTPTSRWSRTSPPSRRLRKLPRLNSDHQMTSALKTLSAALFSAALCFLAPGAQADDTSAPPFPELSGPVVDQANIIPPDVRASLEQKLRAYDDSSGNQLVVVTVPTLGGYPIEYWGYQLGRKWG